VASTEGVKKRHGPLRQGDALTMPDFLFNNALMANVKELSVYEGITIRHNAHQILDEHKTPFKKLNCDTMTMICDTLKPGIAAFKAIHADGRDADIEFDEWIDIIQRLHYCMDPSDQNKSTVEAWWRDLLNIYYLNEPRMRKIYKKHNTPSALYRYYNITDFSNDDLAQLFTHIKTADPHTYNDYFEYLPPFTDCPISTISFSSESPKRSKNAQLMFGHYTKKEHGICIEYNIIPDSPPFYLSPIKYVLKHGDVKADFKNSYHPDQMLRLKFKCWEYEKEWRFIHLNKQGLEPLENLHFNINTVFAVPNINKEKSEILKQQCDQHGIRYEPLISWFGGDFIHW
jgi:hypothetical protein